MGNVFTPKTDMLLIRDSGASDTCHIVVAEDVPCLNLLVEEHRLCLTHLTIPVIQGRELFSIGMCLHSSFFSFFYLLLDWK